MTSQAPPREPLEPGQDPPPAPRPSASVRLAQRVVRRAQHRIASALGVDEDRRAETALTMLENNLRRAPGYWIQLVLSMGIATLGLVLGSTAVVIGAMLVSPLMGPIIELGMGFAVGSALLVIRSAIRIALSVLAVVLGAAILTVALPYHEVTAEIAARTAPTALDLLVAIFCALAAAYTAVRPGSDTAAAAAGTAIGIALVPPLCTAGFGLGTLSGPIAGGATLLFVANLSAILVFAVVSFLLLGYNRVDAATLEQQFQGRDTRTDRIAVRAHAMLRDAFGSRYGLWVRVLVPLLFLSIVYVPLGRALDEVAWEVRTRDAIRRIVNEAARTAVQTAMDVDRRAVAVRLVILASADSAAALQRALETRIAAASGVTPTVSVLAVPDIQAMNATVAKSRPSEPPPAPVPLAEARDRVRQALAQTWPEAVAGPLVAWELVTTSAGRTSLVARHMGPALGVAAESLLARAVSARVGQALTLRSAALPPDPVDLSGADGPRALARLIESVATLDSAAGVQLCIGRPGRAARRPSRADRALLAVLDSAGAAAATVADAPGWQARVSVRGCAEGTAAR